jgi:hypothetical protein
LEEIIQFIKLLSGLVLQPFIHKIASLMCIQYMVRTFQILNFIPLVNSLTLFKGSSRAEAYSYPKTDRKKEFCV